MSSQIRITFLVDNITGQPLLLAEHGLAVYIEVAGNHILFDTGQSQIIMANANCLHIDLQKLDFIVLSHGHYDHTGGLLWVLDYSPEIPIYLHPDALKPKYSCPKDNPPRYIGMPPLTIQYLKHLDGTNILRWTEKPTEITPDVWVTGPIPRLTDYENTGGPFFLDSTGQIPDPINDDQALIINSADGLIILCGCAHSGVVNTLRYAEQWTGQKRIFALLGGLHLQNASEDRINRTLDALRSYQIQQIGLAHCTGASAAARFGENLAGVCSVCRAGDEYIFSLPFNGLVE